MINTKYLPTGYEELAIVISIGFNFEIVETFIVGGDGSYADTGDTQLLILYILT